MACTGVSVCGVGLARRRAAQGPPSSKLERERELRTKLLVVRNDKTKTSRAVCMVKAPLFEQSPRSPTNLHHPCLDIRSPALAPSVAGLMWEPACLEPSEPVYLRCA